MSCYFNQSLWTFLREGMVGFQRVRRELTSSALLKSIKWRYCKMLKRAELRKGSESLEEPSFYEVGRCVDRPLWQRMQMLETDRGRRRSLFERHSHSRSRGSLRLLNDSGPLFACCLFLLKIKEIGNYNHNSSVYCHLDFRERCEY